MFDNMAKTFFKETTDGKTVYYGNGLLRKGYIVEDEAQKEKIYKYHKKVFTYILPLGILYAFIWGISGASWEGGIPVIIVALALTYQKKKLTKNLSLYEEKLKPNEVKNRFASAFPMWFVVLMVVNGTIAILFAVVLMFIDDGSVENVQTIALILFMLGLPLFGLGIYMYKNKNIK